ncbi:MAG: aminotransferase class V-fold PLP-dependent enzyme [FCB group bacterium]|nr:aminotransferase class V-fold PLP-dependent enzyme [FCB group bacterium]
MPNSKNTLSGEALLAAIQSDFIGLDTKYKLATGDVTRRIYLDSTASTLMMGSAYRAAADFLRHYSNTHSMMHYSARIATDTFAWAHDRIRDFVGADADEYTCFFTGSGVTAGMNRMARTFKHLRPERNIVLISIMEHHSNDLPHRKHGGTVIHIPVDTHESHMGCIDLVLLKTYLEEYRDKINYVSVTGISNVTGIINPINEVARLVHEYGAYLIVDAAQMAAHVPIRMSGHQNPLHNVDALVISGHKTYAPGSPGVVIARKSLLENLEPEEVGGGMVDRVFPESYIISDKFPTREEAGTPNIYGAVLLGAAIDILDRIGMERVLRDDQTITNRALEAMLKFEDVVVYGETDVNSCPRAGTISFNIRHYNHGLVAAILNDYFNIAVRNECFCAHPYVEKMLELTHSREIHIARVRQVKDWHAEPWMGMVRVSFGIYNTSADVDHFIHALAEIIRRRDEFKDLYFINDQGDYEHKTFKFKSAEYFCLNAAVENEIDILAGDKSAE